jgi:hypothetical protein
VQEESAHKRTVRLGFDPWKDFEAVSLALAAGNGKDLDRVVCCGCEVE